MSTTTNLGDELKAAYKKGNRIDVVFVKRDGTDRKMTIQRDPVMESNVKGLRTESWTNDNLRVVERITDENGNPISQWRSIPLNRIKTFNIVVEAL